MNAVNTSVATKATAIRRRGTVGDPLRKVTMRFRESVTQAVKAAVAAGDAPSADSFVEQAVVAALRERRRARLYAAYAEAASDELFLSDMAQATQRFDVAIGDGLSVD